MKNEQQEQRAFEALVIQGMRLTGDVDVDPATIREATSKEQQALDNVRQSGFLAKLLAGEITESEDDENCDHDDELACAGAGGTLFRSEGIDEETAQELDEADQKIIERKLRERREQEDDQTS